MSWSWPLRISADTPAIVTNVFRGFLSPSKNVLIAPRLWLGHFRPVLLNLPLTVLPLMPCGTRYWHSPKQTTKTTPHLPQVLITCFHYYMDKLRFLNSEHRRQFKVFDFEVPRKIFSEVRTQSLLTETIINGWCYGTVNMQLKIGSLGLCIQVLLE